MLYFKARAKINLFLHCIGKLPNGYHNLQSLVAFADIYDIIKLKLAKTYSLNINGDFANTLNNSTSINDNIITKTFNLFKKTFNLNSNVEINLTKNLPLGAGIGGGSSDCAVVILGLIKLFNLKINKEDLIQLALQIGSDIPVCLHQKIAIMEGIGDKITPYKLNKRLYIILINPNIILPTKDVFANLTAPYNAKINIANTGNIIDFLKQHTNDLLNSAISIQPSLIDILKELQNTKPILANMSGSGSTFFALYDDFKQINQVLPYLYKKFPQYWIKASYLR